MAEPIEIKITGDNDSGKALADAEQGVKALGDSAKAAGTQMSKASSDVDSFTSHVSKSSKATDEQATRLDRAGESADNAETRFTGLASGIDGVTTLMDDPSPQEFAQGIADMADGAANSLVPALSKGRDMLGGLIDKMGGAKTAALTAAGAAGVGALLIVVKELGEAAHDARIDDLTESFLATGDAGDTMREAVKGNVAAQADMADIFDKLLDQNPVLAQQYLNQAEALGLDKDMVDEAQRSIDRKKAADENARKATEDHTTSIQEEAAAIRDANDARRAALDPIFGVVDAIRSNEEAQRNLDEAERAASDARKEHGASSQEYADAVRAVEDAQIDAAASAGDMESAASDLEAQIEEHPATLSNARLALQRWVDQGLISNETARVMALRFQNAANKADDIQGTRTADLRARDNASGKVISVGNRLRDLDGQTATIHIGAAVGAAVGNILNQAYYLATHAAGGPIGHAAAGGPRGSPVWMHEQGPEIAVHPDGSMVIPAGKSRTIMDAAATGLGGMSGPVVNVYAQGSILTERDVVGMVVQALRDKGLVPA